MATAGPETPPITFMIPLVAPATLVPNPPRKRAIRRPEAMANTAGIAA
jgi:hypothetical protein